MKRISPFFLNQALLISLLMITFNGFSQECGYIYVTPNGAPSGVAGTRDTPADLTYGLSLVDAQNVHLRIAHGEYTLTQALVLADGVTLEGGFRASDWIKTNADASIFHRTADNHDLINQALKGIDCQSISAFSIRDITINIDDAPVNGVSIYGIYVNGCTQYTISRCVINTGSGSDGATGTVGETGISGTDGTNGETGQDEGPCCTDGGFGGVGSFAGSNPGGDGGDGGEWGGFVVEEVCLLGFCQWIITPGSEFTNPGNPGGNGIGVGGGQGGTRGEGLCELTYANTNCVSNTFNRGEDGNDGADGIDGGQGFQGLATITAGYFTPGTGSVGDNGTSHGAGGGGGGGGGAKGCEPAALDPYFPTSGSAPYAADTAYNTAGAGAGGGGGGEGGQIGLGGGGGSGGGGSFCIFVYNNGINGVVQDCFFNPGNGGVGGAGGAGGVGGSGGTGGLGGVLGDNGPNHSCSVGEGGNGGSGGSGGIGGDGGLGSDGTSAGLFQENGEPVLDPNIYNPWEPEIEVEYFGCTNSMVQVSTTATGNLNWIFGFGADPQNSESTSDTVFFTAPTGFRSFTLIVDGVPYFYANYIEIRDEFDPSEIDADRTTICVGEDITLATSASALSYSWVIPTGSTATSDQQDVGTVTFNTVGDHIVELTTTSCCGTSRTTDTIHVLQSVEVDLGPDQSACFLGELPTLDGNGNDGASYSWAIDGTATGADEQFLGTTITGDYTVEVSYGPNCSGSDTVVVSIYTESPVDLGENTAICAGQSLPILDASVPNASYAWTFNGNPIGENAQTLEVFVPGDYEVSVTEVDGCTGSDDVVVVVSDPFVDLGPDITVCENDSFPTIDGGSQGVTYNWILNGDTVATGQTFQPSTIGNYTLMMTNQFGCVATDMIQLNDAPAINAAFNGPVLATLGTPMQFTDITGQGSAWTWNFGDGSPVVNQQNPTHAFIEVGPRPVFMIVSNGFCVDTAFSVVDVIYDCTTVTVLADFTYTPSTVVLSGQATVSVTNNSTGATTYEWDFGDGTPIETEFEPTHAYAVPGDYVITLNAFNYNCQSSDLGVVAVVPFGVGVEELDATTHVVLFPNPTKTDFVVSAEFEKPTSGTIELNNELGQTVITRTFHPTTRLLKHIETTGLTSGIYLLKLTTTNGVSHTKLIIAR